MRLMGHGLQEWTSDCSGKYPDLVCEWAGESARNPDWSSKFCCRAQPAPPDLAPSNS